MPKFFAEPFKIGNDRIIIDTDDVSHITKVLRHRKGDVITVCDGMKSDYTCRISEITREIVVCDILEKRANTAEPSLALTLFLALPKGDKADFVIQKSVELGVSRVVMFEGENSVAKCPKDAREVKKKLDKWQKTAREAAKQCGRGIIPEVSGIFTFKAAIKEAERCGTVVFLHEKEKNGAVDDAVARGVKSAALFVGPEGGFSPAEAEYASSHGAHIAGLGSRVLRLETAALAVQAVIMHITHNL
ncbi:MAG: 16S rRNA (uracil(1498)-N(3))-methyltransferase [Clostridia bacterium]|nr:16S rRNA (uracil(1498)-N(3))-methyltransferase [Clostridia bacterium]